MRLRLRRMLILCALILGAGLLYAFWCSQTGLSIPCFFYILTGLRCPGCGSTRVCLNLLKLDFSAAFWANPFLFIILPFGSIWLIYRSVLYIRSGDQRLSKIETRGVWCCVILLFIWGILRNIFYL